MNYAHYMYRIVRMLNLTGMPGQTTPKHIKTQIPPTL